MDNLACRDARKSLLLSVRLLASLVIYATTALAGCGENSAPAPAAANESGVPAPPPLPAKKVDLEKPVLRIETTAGTITLQLDAISAPGTVRNFLNYANEGFYDNTLVHFVDAGKLIVAGGYSTDGQPKPGNTPIRNEAHNGLKNIRGTVAMTRDPSQIDSATSQFFINLSDAPQRDHAGDSADTYGYCVFGRVTDGLDVADKISKCATTDRGGDLAQMPEPAVIIKSVRMVR